MNSIFSMCGAREEKTEKRDIPVPLAGEEGGEQIADAYRPQRLNRELLDDEATENAGGFFHGRTDQLPSGTPRSNFMVGKEPAVPVKKQILTMPTVPLMPGGKAPSTLSAPVGVSPQQAEILADELKKEGNQLYNDGQLEAAEMVYSEAIKYAPKNHVLFSNRSMCYGKLGKYADALTDAKTVVAMMPTWCATLRLQHCLPRLQRLPMAKGFARLAAALEALGKNKDALAAYEKARWLAQAHDNDPQGEQEYVEAVHALKLRMSMRDMGGYTRVM